MIRFLAVTLFLSAFSFTAFAQKPLQVLDYFDLAVKGDNSFAALVSNDRRKIETNDTENGYLKMTGAFEGWIDVKLFRFSNGEPLLVVGVNTCGPACGSDLEAFTFEGKNAIRAAELLPWIEESELAEKQNRVRGKETELIGVLYQLPQKGTNIVVSADDTGDKLFDVEWTGKKFAVKRNVLDLYSLYPDSALRSGGGGEIKIVKDDPKNGYLKLKNDESVFDVGLFRDKDGEPLLVYTENRCNGEICKTLDFEAIRFDGILFSNATRDVLPSAGEFSKRGASHPMSENAGGDLIIVPEKGTSIKIIPARKSSKPVILIWNRERFTFSK
ncbi:MAG: hypothetical protein R2684_06190 [Pyrinomonadaceae bacterium]